ncbi:MAG: hypothetical protein R3304_01175 [Longimicrobiales bacterium]|nr:hypothetical protein [Longimicrobiales bacterium]
MSPKSPRIVAFAALLALGACEPAIVDPAPADGVDPAFAMRGGGGGGEYANVMDQDGIHVYSEDGAHIVRQPNGLLVSVTMPTPEPGTYVYPTSPPGIVPGHPEVFTLWVFAFNHPEKCTDGVCNADDLGSGAAAKGSVYNGGGHVASGASMTITGRLGVGEEAFNDQPLMNPAGAEIHLAVTSHGALSEADLPNEFRTPTGPGTCGCWWLSFFKGGGGAH